jgi:hypothetical protein
VSWRRAALSALLGLAVAADVATAGDPHRQYRTLESPHFIVYYWDSDAGAGREPGALDMDDVARRFAVAAERAHAVLSPALDQQPATKTLIYVTDDTDSANGFASVLPRNAIQVYATAPSGFSELDDYDDWV